MTLLIETASMWMSTQDLGRFGYRRFGMPESGPMDWWAFYGANRLVDNHDTCACIEIGFSSTAFTIEKNTLMAVCGSGYQIYVNQRKIPLWMSFWVKVGDYLRIEKIPGGNWCYLAVRGGIDSLVWMGSRSVYPRAGIGRMLQAGDQLLVADAKTEARLFAGRSIPDGCRPAYRSDPVICVVPGPHQARFQDESLQTFWREYFIISTDSDRMGYRLTGPQLHHTDGADLVSQGMALGEIQVPADGNPIVMMPDHPTTGGYTSIGTIASVDLPLLAQTPFGQSSIRFKPVDVLEAQQSLIATISQISSIDDEEGEPWHQL